MATTRRPSSTRSELLVHEPGRFAVDVVDAEIHEIEAQPDGQGLRQVHLADVAKGEEHLPYRLPLPSPDPVGFLELPAGDRTPRHQDLPDPSRSPGGRHAATRRHRRTPEPSRHRNDA
jgi:hypothetical protein